MVCLKLKCLDSSRLYGLEKQLVWSHQRPLDQAKGTTMPPFCNWYWNDYNFLFTLFLYIFLLLRDWTSAAILWWKHPAVNEGRKAATISWTVIIYIEKDHHFNDGWAIVDTDPEKLTDCHVVICWWWPLSRGFNKSNGNGIFPCYNGPQQIYLAFIVWPMRSNDIFVTIVKTPFLFKCLFSLTITFLIQFSLVLKLILIWVFIPPKFELTFLA